MAEALTHSTCLDDDQFAALLPAEAGGLTVRAVGTLRCIALRHLPGGLPAIESALACEGLPTPPSPGRITGYDPWLLWQSPSESLLMATAAAEVENVLAALHPGRHALACAVDLSDGLVVIELHGPWCQMEAVLSRLIDSSAIPRVAGHGTTARLAAISVRVLRLSDDRVWLLAACSHGDYVALWLAHATPEQRDAAAPVSKLVSQSTSAL